MSGVFGIYYEIRLDRVFRKSFCVDFEDVVEIVDYDIILGYYFNDFKKFFLVLELGLVCFF